MNGLIIAIIVAALSAMFGSKGRQEQSNRSKSKRRNEMTEALEELMDGFSSKDSGKRLQDWWSNEPAEHPYIDDDDDDEEEAENQWVTMAEARMEQQPEHTTAHHMQTDEEYDYVVESAYGEQGMDGQVAAQGCETISDVRIVKRSKQHAGNENMEDEQLLRALNDLPSAIIAAEVLGPPKSRRAAGHMQNR